MKALVIDSTRKVKLFGSKEAVERKVKLTATMPETADEANTLFNGDLWRWAVLGYRSRLNVEIQRRVTGGGDRSASREFGIGLQTLTTVAGMSHADALALLETKFPAQVAAMKATGLVEITVSKPADIAPDWDTADADADEDTDDSDV